MKAYVVDDNFIIGKKIKSFIDDLVLEKSNIEFDITIVDNILAFYEGLTHLEITDDMVFILDIDLKTYFSGIDLGKTIRSKNDKCYIIYLTSYENKALTVLNSNIYPWSYIVKCIDFEEFKNSLNKALEEITYDQLSREQSLDFTSFSVQNRKIVVPVKDIMYLRSIKGCKNSILVKTFDEDIIADSKLKNYKTIFTQPYMFNELRPYIINLKSISEWSRYEQYIGFVNGEVLELGIKSIDKVKKALREIGYN